MQTISSRAPFDFRQLGFQLDGLPAVAVQRVCHLNR
jgi:hypothetical protein